MKTTIKICLAAAALFLVTSATTANAQQKSGYINSVELLQAMPEMDSINKKLESYSAELEAEFNALLQEFQTKYQDYQAKASTMSDILRKQREKELNDMQVRLEGYRESSNQLLSEEQSKLVNPVIEKVKAALEKIGKDNNLLVIYDLSIGSLVYHNTAAMVDVLPLAKKALGITK